MASNDQVVCEPCSRGDNVSSGYSWCSDCEEILCAVCDKSHRVGKLTLSHHVTKVHDLPFIPKEAIINLRFCDNHPEKIVDFYCAFHDVICCQTCILESHRACQQVKVIDEVSGEIRSSALVEDVSKAVSLFVQTSETIMKNRTSNRDSVAIQEATIKSSISKLKQDLLEQVDFLEKSLLSDLANVKEETIAQLDIEITESRAMSEHWQKIKKELDFNIEYGSINQLFRLTEKLKQQISEEEIHLKEKIRMMKNVDINYFVEADISHFISALATINPVRGECGIILPSHITERAQFVPATISFVPAKSIDLSSIGICSITGIEITEDNKLLLCCFNSKRLLILKVDGTLVKERRLEHSPYQASIIPKQNQAAVSSPVLKCILIINIDNLTTIREVTTENFYFAIQTFDNVFLVGGNSSLEIISQQGNVNRELPAKGGSVRFVRKRQNDTVLYTNYHKLYCVRLLDGTEVFEYSSSTEARGIAEDTYGCIYVSDKGQKNIHRLAPDGTFVDIVVTEKDIGGTPLALRFSNDYSKLYVGLDQTDTLAIFQCNSINYLPYKI